MRISMTLHEIVQEIKSIDDALTTIGKKTPKPWDDETEKTLSYLLKVKAGLEVLWWRKAGEYADNYGN